MMSQSSSHFKWSLEHDSKLTNGLHSHQIRDAVEHELYGGTITRPKPLNNVFSTLLNSGCSEGKTETTFIHSRRHQTLQFLN